jgi:hypothetical protein
MLKEVQCCMAAVLYDPSQFSVTHGMMLAHTRANTHAHPTDMHSMHAHARANTHTSYSRSSCSTKPTRRFAALVKRIPLAVTLPLVRIARGVRPLMTESRLVLPLPLGPISASTSPGRISPLMSNRICRVQTNSRSRKRGVCMENPNSPETTRHGQRGSLWQGGQPLS